MRQLLLLIALLLMACGAVVTVVAGSGPKWSRWATYGMASAASGLLAAVGALCVSGHTVTVDLGNLLDFGQTRLLLDPLAGLFLTLVGALGVVISLSMLNWPPPSPAGGRASGWAYMLLLAAVTVVVVAADAFTFLFAWEALTVAFYVLVLATRADRDQPGAAWATAGVGAWGGASLLVGFSLLAGAAHSFNFAPWARLSASGLHATAYALIVFGFATKVGLAPFQGWMPRGYPAAPGPARAAMAGLAVNAGFYGLWRFLALLGRPPGWLAVTVLVLGGVTALLGIAFAAVQSDLNRVIAYSSIENGGLIMVGYGVALAGASEGNGVLTAVGLLAASLQLLAHAVAKSGLFLGSANFQPGSDGRAVERSFGHAAHPGLGLGRVRRLRAHIGRAAADDRLCLRMVHVRGLDAAVPPPLSGAAPGDGQRRGARCPHGRGGRLHLCPVVGLRRLGPRSRQGTPTSGRPRPVVTHDDGPVVFRAGGRRSLDGPLHRSRARPGGGSIGGRRRPQITLGPSACLLQLFGLVPVVAICRDADWVLGRRSGHGAVVKRTFSGGAPGAGLALGHPGGARS